MRILGSKQAFGLCKSRYYPDVELDVLKSYNDKLHLKIKNHPPVKFTEVEKRNVIKEWDEIGFDEFRKKVIWRETFKA